MTLLGLLRVGALVMFIDFSSSQVKAPPPPLYIRSHFSLSICAPFLLSMYLLNKDILNAVSSASSSFSRSVVDKTRSFSHTCDFEFTRIDPACPRFVDVRFCKCAEPMRQKSSADHSPYLHANDSPKNTHSRAHWVGLGRQVPPDGRGPDLCHPPGR